MSTTQPMKVKTYNIPPTPLVPNSPHVLIHYPSLLQSLVSAPSFNPVDIFDLFASNGWQSQWIARYARNQRSHYHSTAHEAMVVISGQGAMIRFGVADADGNEDGNAERGEEVKGDAGIELQAGLGDVFILPAGVAHKTHDPVPDAQDLLFMAPENVTDEQASRSFFEGCKVDGGFMMMGAYPKGGVWDFMVGGEHKGQEEVVWNVPLPAKDPVVGDNEDGLVGLWVTEPSRVKT